VGNQTLYIARDVSEKISKKNTDRSMSEMGGTPTYGHLSKANDDEPNAMKNPIYQPFHRTQFHKPLYWDGLWHWVYHIHDLINQWMELGGFPVHTCSD